jgi:hypothetical protein
MDLFNQYVVGNVDSVLANQYAGAAVGLFLALYAGKAAPELPSELKELFNNQFFRVTCLFLIAYLNTKSTQISLVVAIGFVVVMNKLSQEQTAETFIEIMNTAENFKNENENEF